VKNQRTQVSKSATGCRTYAASGTLTEDERDEYATYVRAGNLISILQAKTRKFL